MLADDERMVRLGLKSMLDELYPNTHTYIEAKNGKELVTLAAEHKPHIAFVDIRMPLLNGLAAINECKNITPSTKWLMLTGYSDFDYAKEAIKLGVSDYLLKPVSLTELAEAMTRTAESIKTHLDKLNHTFALDVISAYNTFQVCTTVEPFIANVSLQDLFETYTFYIDNWDRNIRYTLLTKLNESLKQICSNMMDSDLRYALFYLSSGELCLVTSKCKNAISICAFLTDFINCSKDPITIFHAVHSSVQHICLECTKLSEISHVRLIYKLGTIIDYNELLQHKDLQVMLQFANTVERLCLAFIQGEELEYKNIIKDMSKNEAFQKLFPTIHSKNIEKYLKAAIGYK